MAKAPKKPKTTASVAAWKKYDERVKKYHSDKKTKENLIKKHRGF
jgi:hypothetical protein